MVTTEKLDALIRVMKGSQENNVPLPDFKGELENDIQEHVEMFEKLSLLNNWDEVTKRNRFIKTLKNSALDYVMNKVIDVTKNTQWNEIKTKMIEKYKKDEDAWELIISQSEQKESEDPQIYVTKIEKLCKK